MGEGGTSSQVSVVCGSHGWLEVEERESSFCEEKEEVKIEVPSLAHVRTLLYPFIRQGGRLH
jgi:hypothetical protein